MCYQVVKLSLYFSYSPLLRRPRKRQYSTGILPPGSLELYTTAVVGLFGHWASIYETPPPPKKKTNKKCLTPRHAGQIYVPGTGSV